MPLLSSVERADGQVIDQDALARRRRQMGTRRDVRLCHRCNQRPAVISETGETEDEGLHTLCFVCFRERLSHPKAPQPISAVEDRVELHTRPEASAAVEDRDQLYSDLRLRLRRAQIAARHASEEPEAAAPAADAAPLSKAS